MKTLKKLLLATSLAGSLIFGATNKLEAQDTPKTSKEKLLPNLNFYFETGEYANYKGYPEFKKYIGAWLSSTSKEGKNGTIWFDYGDTDDDGVYDYVGVENNSPPIRYREKFSFNFDTKKIDYVLDIYDFCSSSINDCDKIITKSYDRIDQKEAEYLGEDFFKRIKKFYSVQKEFSRFNTGQLEELVRKEYSYQLKMDNGKLVGNSRIPIKKFLSEEEIKKVENYIREKPERERIKKEQEEKLKEFNRQREEVRKIEYEKQEKIRREQEEARKIEYEKQEKIRLEQEKIRMEQERIEKEARKPKARLKIGTGIARPDRGSPGVFLGITPQLTNKKGRGFAAGLDIFVMDSERSFELFGGIENGKKDAGPNEYLISHTSYTHNVLEKSTNRLGLNIGYVFPVFEVFANAGFLKRKMSITTTAVTEEYIEKNGIKQGQSSFKTEKTAWGGEAWGGEKFFGPFYFGLGTEIFPFLKKNDYKNISFSIDGLIVLKKYIPYTGYKSSPKQFIINAGIKYTLRK